MRSSVIPQPPADPINSKTPRSRGVHFSADKGTHDTATSDDGVSAAELNEKVEAMLVILHKAKADREELLNEISALKAERRKKDEVITEGAKKRMIEERAFRDTLLKERIVADNRWAKQRESLELRNSFILEMAMFLTSLEANHPKIQVQDMLQKAYAVLPSSLEACGVLRKQLGLQEITTITTSSQRQNNSSPKPSKKKSKRIGSSPQRAIESSDDEGTAVRAPFTSDSPPRHTDNIGQHRDLESNPFTDMTEKFVAGLEGNPGVTSLTSSNVHTNERVMSSPRKHSPVHEGDHNQMSQPADYNNIAISTPDIQSPNLNPVKPHHQSSGQKYMRPNPKLKPNPRLNARGMNETNYKMVSADNDDDVDDDVAENGNYLSNSHSKRVDSPKEKLLIIQEMIGTSKK